MMTNETPIDLFDFVGKIVVIGETSVGKTKILIRYCKNEFGFNSNMTIGVEFFSKVVSYKEKTMKFQIWDTAGQERYKSITNSFFTNTTAAIIVFDLSNIHSFEKVDFWMNEVKKYTKDNLIMVLIGNKSDLDHKISPEEIKKKSEFYKIDYFQTSALMNKNINEAFEKIISTTFYRISQINSEYEKEFEFKDSFMIKKTINNDIKNENRKGCC